MRPQGAGRADRREEVVVLQRQVVGVAGVLGLLHPGQLAGRLRRAVIDVIALPGRAAAELRQGECGDVVRLDERPPVVGDSHPAAEFARQEGIPPIVDSRCRADAAHVGADGEVVAHVAEGEVHHREVRDLDIRFIPEPVGVAPVDGDQRIERHLGGAPAGGRPERRADAVGLGQLAQRREVLRLVVELVVDLHGDDRRARVLVVAEEPGELPPDVRVPLADQCEVVRVVGPVCDGQPLQPVGEAAVAGLAVCPRPDPQHDLEPHRLGRLHEAAHVEVEIPSPLAATLLVQDPDQVRGHEVDAARLHLAELVLPPLGRGRG